MSGPADVRKAVDDREGGIPVILVYARPEYIDTLDRSRPISDFVPVDFELRGCPISKSQLIELVTSLLIGRKPRVPTNSVCLSCKQLDTVCLMVAQDTGGAIRAPGRCDVYMGLGDQAGQRAGATCQEGRLYYLFLKGTSPNL